MPVFNDWDSALMLVEQLDRVGSELEQPIQVILVDDGSTERRPTMLQSPTTCITRVGVIQLRRNVGHQRAIALGLAYICENYPDRLVVVMDADGEDSPSDIEALVDRCRQTGYSRIVFAKRKKRTEGFVFCVGYLLFRALHFLLTGRGISIGNFSVIPAGCLPRVVGVSELWNHYAAGIIHARLPTDTVSIDRSRRLTGASKMNFVALVTHGMSAISVYGDTVGVRLLCAISFLTALVLGGLVTVVGIRFFTDLAIPGWATNAFGLLAVLLTNLLMLATVFVLFMLQSRNMAGFLPVRDWEQYVASETTIFER